MPSLILHPIPFKMRPLDDHILCQVREAKKGSEDEFRKDESCLELFSHNMLGKSQNGVKLQELHLLDFGKLATARNNFHPTNMLGKGGFGPVYKGKLQDGQEIAVKRLSRASGQGLEEFRNEAMVISRLQHRNLDRPRTDLD
ncbi:G-type lectin S-receptor-like serine/threonine-protein kinase At1g11300 isoform X6 [Gossypium hirsutum]|uniref:G-type lectin S-receptor-like serine/threonine-protein kinase At1g11300 isoform X6 n=1 Tax=Gossypium hirsutum TaxID=3635 RepID=A0ABM3BU97_GOSHI|nr:G-type lectin S-receptor-like serine/threonine-protein kinase At1g11300 isoform X6 [Gossypium hirsutum]